MHKRPELHADHSPASSTELKSEWSHTTAFSIRLLDVNTENFAFTFPLSVRFKGDLWLDLFPKQLFLVPCVVLTSIPPNITVSL